MENTKVKDEALYKAYHNFMALILAEFKLMVGPDETQRLPVEQIIVKVEKDQDSIFGEGIPLYRTTDTSVPSFRGFVLEHFEKLASANKDLLDPLVQQLFNSKFTGKIPLEPLGLYFIRADLGEIVEKQQGFKLDEGLVAQQYAKLMAFLTAPEIIYKALHLVENVEIDVNRLELDSYHVLRYPDEADKALYGRDPFYAVLKRLDYVGASHHELLLEVETHHPKSEEKIDSSLGYREVEKVLLALRLFKGGAIGSQPLFSYNEAYPKALPLTEYSQCNRFFGDTKYKLEEGEIEPLKAFWKDFLDLYPLIEQFLAVPKDRLMSSYNQEKPLNRLLDLVIGLESIFSENAESIVYKYALRGAVATGSSVEEREEFHQILKEAYAARSAVAHGGHNLSNKTRRKLEDKAAFEEFIEQLRQILVRAILRSARWLQANSGAKGDEFIAGLDKALLSTESYSFYPANRRVL